MVIVERVVVEDLEADRLNASRSTAKHLVKSRLDRLPFHLSEQFSARVDLRMRVQETDEEVRSGPCSSDDDELAISALAGQESLVYKAVLAIPNGSGE